MGSSRLIVTALPDGSKLFGNVAPRSCAARLSLRVSRGPGPVALRVPSTGETFHGQPVMKVDVDSNRLWCLVLVFRYEQQLLTRLGCGLRSIAGCFDPTG